MDTRRNRAFHDHATRRRNDQYPLKPKHNMGKRTFKYAGTICYNALPVWIKSAPSLSNFKSLIAILWKSMKILLYLFNSLFNMWQCRPCSCRPSQSWPYRIIDIPYWVIKYAFDHCGSVAELIFASLIRISVLILKIRYSRHAERFPS